LKQKLTKDGNKLELTPETKDEEDAFRVLAKNFVWEKGDKIILGEKAYRIKSINKTGDRTELDMEEI